jgi:hypothetical protein
LNDPNIPLVENTHIIIIIIIIIAEIVHESSSLHCTALHCTRVKRSCPCVPNFLRKKIPPMRRTRLSSLAVAGLATIFVLTGTLAAVAAAGQWSTPVTLSDAGAAAESPQLVTDGTTITATWYRSDGINIRIQAASSDDAGLTWSTPATLSDAGGDAYAARLVTNGTTVTAIWFRNDGSNNRIQAAASDDAGFTWSTPVTISDAGGAALFPQLVTNGTTITATWYRNDGSNNRIQAASSVDGGLTWSTPETISEAGGDANRPQLVSDGTTITATWFRNDGINNRIQAASSDDGGLTWSTPETISEAGTYAVSPQLVTDGTTVTAVWVGNDGINNRIQAASSDDGGLTWSTPETISEAGAAANKPMLVTDGTTITATWYRNDDINDRIQAASSVDGGLTWSTPATLSEAGGMAFFPQLVTDGTTIRVAWSGENGSGYLISVASSVDGGLTWSTPESISEAGQNALYPQLVTDGTATTVAWHRFDSSNNRVQAASLMALVDEPAEPAEPILAATGTKEALAMGLLAGGLLLAGGILTAARLHGRRTA